MLDPRYLLHCTAGHRQHRWHEEAGRHLAPCNDGAHQRPGVGHGKEVAVVRCGVPRQQPHIEEEGKLRLNELSLFVRVPAPCMNEKNDIADTSDCQPCRLVTVVYSLIRTDPTVCRMTPSYRRHAALICSVVHLAAISSVTDLLTRYHPEGAA